MKSEIDKLETGSAELLATKRASNNSGFNNTPKLGLEDKFSTSQVSNTKIIPVKPDSNSYKWDKFKLEIKKLDEPLLASILHQVQFARFEPELNHVWVDLDQNLSFFQDILQDQRQIWLPKLQVVFGEHMSLEIRLISSAILPEIILPAVDLELVSVENITLEDISSGPVNNLNNNNLSNLNHITSVISIAKNITKPVGNNIGAINKYKNLDFANQARWPKVKLVLDFFPGTLSEISE